MDNMEQDMSKHQMGGMKCPGCGMQLELNPVDHNSEATPEDMPSMDEAASMPLDKLREKLPKKAE